MNSRTGRATVRRAGLAVAMAAGVVTGVLAGEGRAETMAEVLAASAAADWRPLDPERTLVMTLPAGPVVIELAPAFAPNHVANIKALVREGYFDGLAVTRVQDGFVAQWGDPGALKSPPRPRPIRTARPTLKAEFERPADGLAFTPLPDRDSYAPQTGFVDALPAARDPATGVAWAVHCYGTVGVGRDLDADSGGGGELYAVIGHAPRQLDRNITVVGRVVEGMDRLASLPRGTGPLGFYEQDSQLVPIARVRLVADLPPAARPKLEVLRTDTAIFTRLVESRRNRRDDFYKHPAGAIDVCNVPLPVRPRP